LDLEVKGAKIKEYEPLGQEVLPNQPYEEEPVYGDRPALSVDEPEWLCSLTAHSTDFRDLPVQCLISAIENDQLAAPVRDEKSIVLADSPLQESDTPYQSSPSDSILTYAKKATYKSKRTFESVTKQSEDIGIGEFSVTIQDFFNKYKLSAEYERGSGTKVEFKDKIKVEAQKKKAIDILQNDKQCRKFLATIEGLKIDELIEAVKSQNIYDGKNSTIDRLSAGVIPNDVLLTTDAAKIESNASIKNKFTLAGDPNALTAIYTGPIIENRTSVGKPADRNDVYYRKINLVTSARIIHEALHSLFGIPDSELALKFNVSITPQDTSAITEKLKEMGCGK
jgi:hypothetical protein